MAKAVKNRSVLKKKWGFIINLMSHKNSLSLYLIPCPFHTMYFIVLLLAPPRWAPTSQLLQILCAHVCVYLCIMYVYVCVYNPPSLICASLCSFFPT